MTRHLLTLVWNRKRTTVLVMAEIAAAFLVLLAVTALGVYAFDNWRRPLGFTWERVWDIEIEPRSGNAMEEREVIVQAREGDPARPSSGAGPQAPSNTPSPAPGETPETPSRSPEFEQLLLALHEFPEIEASAASTVAPFELGGMVHAQRVNDRRIEWGANEVTDQYADLLGIRVTRGRWFSREDAGQAYDPVVINEALAREAFGDGDPLGRPIVEPSPEDVARNERQTRVVGVIEAYREDGEFEGQRNFALYRKDIENPSTRRDREPRHVLVRLRPGTTAEFEERLVRRLQAVAPNWSFEVRSLDQMRDTANRLVLVPLAVVGLLAASLLLMVGLGLLGVLWQAVTQRTREIGLRRAKGATRGNIGAQILGEIVVMTTLALAPAVVLALQVPLLGPFYWVEWHVYAVALAISLGAIYVLAVMCGWYPARLASSVQPADALRYE